MAVFFLLTFLSGLGLTETNSLLRLKNEKEF